MAKQEDNNVIGYRLSTVIPMEVFIGLLEFAKKEVMTGVGNFDFGLAIKLLLERNKINTKLDNLELEINKLKGGQ